MQAAVRAVALALAGLTAWASDSAAQAITSDGTLGTVVGNGGDNYTISGGTTRGNNLFHSFGQFNVPSFGSAVFDGPASTANVLSRVTGGVPSSIDGLISTRAGASPMPSANFFLINPAGVMFGANAALDVGGAFRVSTADNIRLADGVLFSATPGPDDALLSAAAPQAFGFLNSNPASIVLDGALLAVDSGQTISLVGGDVQLLNGAALLAFEGSVQIASAASVGSAVFDSGLDVSSFSRLGEVLISGGGVSAGGDGISPGGGTVVIRSGQLIIEGGALVTTDAAGVAGAPVGIDIAVTDAMIVRGGSAVLTAGVEADGSAISIRAGNLTVTGVGTTIETQGTSGRSGAIDIQVVNADILDGGKIRNASTANGGNTTIIASGTLTVDGGGSEISTGSNTVGDPSVAGGDIAITVRDLVLRDSGRIRSGGAGEQPGQQVTINASNAVSISSLAGISSQSDARAAGVINISTPRLAMDAGYITTSTLNTGGAGQILINANTVGLANGAQIASSTQIVASGEAGTITINAAGSISISGIGPAGGVGSITFTDVPNSGIFGTTEGTGNAGQITLSTPLLTLAEGGRISVATEGAGSGGTIVANVGSFAISGGARVDSSTTAGGAGGAINVNGTLSINGTGSGLFSTASSTGNAGAIAATGPGVTVANGGTIDSSTTGAGAGGAINVNGTLAISGAGSGLFSTASSTGNAGAVNVTAPNVTVADGGTIDSSTTGAGAGGAINVSAGSQVEIASGGSIRADSLGSGLTGNITVAAGDRIMMDNGSISTRAVTSDGGNITLLAPNVIRLGNSQITTSVESGTGAGGNIFIDPQFVILQGSTITANAFGGPGGSVTIIANNFLSDATSAITASSALSTPGTVTIQSPENNLKEAIAQLPGDLVDASRLMRGACAARQTGAPSSFAVAGRGGVPADADGYLSSFSTTGAPLARAARQEQPDQGVLLAMASLDCAR
jgi:filamentous hemagglutinin family protein